MGQRSSLHSLERQHMCDCRVNQHTGHADDTVLRNWKEKGERRKKDVPIPIPIYNYNKFMGGVDHSNQMIKYYEVL